MLTLQQLFDDLAYSELATIKLGNSNLGSVTEENYPRVVSALNMGLVEIYKRLNLRQGEFKLYQQTGVTEYFVRSDYSALGTNDVGIDSYIVYKEDETFPDDLIKILTATDSAGKPVKINDRKYPTDIFTPSFDVITIAEPSTKVLNADGTIRAALDIFNIKYQAFYPRIVVDQYFNPEEIKLHIPDFIEESLLIYMTYRLVRKPVKIIKGEVAPSSTLWIEFENAIAELKRLKLAIEVEDERDRFTANGWV